MLPVGRADEWEDAVGLLDVEAEGACALEDEENEEEGKIVCVATGRREEVAILLPLLLRAIPDLRGRRG